MSDWSKCEFLSYRISIPVADVSSIVQELKEDEDLNNKEECGSVTEYIFNYLWQHLRNDTPTPTLAMYDNYSRDYPGYFTKQKLETLYPPTELGSGKNVVHFVFQGENGVWDDLTGKHESHEYVIFESPENFWVCQAWVYEYKTTWSELTSLGSMLYVLSGRCVDEDKLKQYFHLSQVPNGFGINQRDWSDYVTTSDLEQDPDSSDADSSDSDSSDSSYSSDSDSEHRSAAGGRKKRRRLQFVDLFPNLRF